MVRKVIIEMKEYEQREGVVCVPVRMSVRLYVYVLCLCVYVCIRLCVHVRHIDMSLLLAAIKIESCSFPILLHIYHSIQFCLH